MEHLDFGLAFQKLIAPEVAELTAVAWNQAISKCAGLANTAGHFMLEAEIWKLKTTPEAVHAAVLKDLEAKED